VYVLAGLFYGIASLLSVARTGAATRTRGRPENLDAISAVVLGGTSLFGGRGVILGTLVGALIVGVFRNGLTLMGVSSVYQILVTGILVILAVATDQLAQRSALIMTQLHPHNERSTGHAGQGPGQALRAGHRARRRRL
jgi:fructose transport system permease protein